MLVHEWCKTNKRHGSWRSTWWQSGSMQYSWSITRDLWFLLVLDHIDHPRFTWSFCTSCTSPFFVFIWQFKVKKWSTLQYILKLGAYCQIQTATYRTKCIDNCERIFNWIIINCVKYFHRHRFAIHNNTRFSTSLIVEVLVYIYRYTAKHPTVTDWYMDK